MFDTYPIAYSNPHIELRLRNIVDVNNALAMEWLYRTDAFPEYQFTDTEIDRDTEKGSYTLIKRPRQGLKLFQPILEI